MGNTNFVKDFKDAKKITLAENYRSTALILRASNTMIRNNQKRMDKEIKPIRGNGAKITILSVPGEREEGGVIVKEIEARMGGTSHYNLMHTGTKDFADRSYSFSDFAVLFRTNAQAKAIEEAFYESGIPYIF